MEAVFPALAPAQVPAAPAIPALLPKPTSVQIDPGTFRLANDTRIAVTPETEGVGKMLSGYLSPATGYDFQVTRRGGRGSIDLACDKRLQVLGDEGYRLRIQTDRVYIRAYRPAGVFYGLQTLRELLPNAILRKAKVDGVDWSVQCLHIEDAPRFAWRGALMDVSRHFEPKSFVEKFLDEMALHKLNRLHWHLTDDNGWRIEIKRYPRLTAISSGSDFSAMNPREATRSKSVLPGGYYTQDDIREVVRYAADRFITIVPEIEMPGHSAAAIAAYPELGNRSEVEAEGGTTKFLGYDNVYNVEDSTVQFLENVLSEVMDLFPSKFVHIGGDEVDKSPWHQNPKAQARMAALELKSEDELQSWFIRQMDAYLTSKGRRLIGWDEILEGGLAPGAAVMSWRGTEGGIAAATSGHDVVMTPGSHTYLDHYQAANGKDEPRAIGGYLPIQTVYAYDPVPSALSPADARHILGSQGQLWSEFIPGPRHLEYMAFPRLCALAEVLWSQPQGRTYEEFLSRLIPHLARLDVLDVSYRKLKPADLQPLPVAQARR